MSESVPLLKLVEVLVVLAAGAGFAWWQFSDLARARRERERQSRAAQEGAAAPHGSPVPHASPAPPEATASSQERP